MLQLATDIHQYILEYLSVGHECICKRT
jgi:hypothetical protein